MISVSRLATAFDWLVGDLMHAWIGNLRHREGKEGFRHSEAGLIASAL